MKTLRQQLATLDRKEFIKTLYGAGYLVEDGKGGATSSPASGT